MPPSPPTPLPPGGRGAYKHLNKFVVPPPASPPPPRSSCSPPARRDLRRRRGVTQPDRLQHRLQAGLRHAEIGQLLLRLAGQAFGDLLSLLAQVGGRLLQLRMSGRQLRLNAAQVVLVFLQARL